MFIIKIPRLESLLCIVGMMMCVFMIKNTISYADEISTNTETVGENNENNDMPEDTDTESTEDIDTKPPEIELILGDDIFDDDILYYYKEKYKNVLPLTIKSTDNTGLSSIEVYLNCELVNSFEKIEDTKEFDISLNLLEGQNSISIKAYDTFGNCNEINKDILGINKPIIEVKKANGNFVLKDNKYIFKDDIEVSICIKSDVDISYVNINTDEKDIVNESVSSINEKEYKINVSECIENDGIISILARDRFGREATYKTFAFYRDDSAPVIKNILCNEKNISENDYEYFGKGKAKISTVINDYDNNKADNGLMDEVNCYLYDYSGEILNVSTMEYDGNAYYVEINPEFNGFIKIEAKDSFGNTAYKQSAKFIIGYEANKYTDLKLEKEKEKNIFSKDTYVHVDINNNFGGIKDVEYKVSAKFDTDNNYTGKFSAKKDINYTIQKNNYDLINGISFDLPVKNNSNDIVVAITVIDNFGGIIRKNMVVNIDKTLPKLDIELNEDISGGFSNKDLTAKVTLVERNFSEDNFKFIFDRDGDTEFESQKTIYKKDEKNPDLDEHITYIDFSKEGEYFFGAEFTDDAGNYIKWEPFRFVIDKTSPKVSISFDKKLVNHKYINEERRANIIVKEKYFNKDNFNILNSSNNIQLGDWEKNGDEYTNSIIIDKEGYYDFSLCALDLAGNISEIINIDPFIVDMTVPEIKIDTPIDNSSNNDKVNPKVVLSDLNLLGSSTEFNILKDGNPISLNKKTYNIPGKSEYRFSSIPKEEKYDGVYSMEIIAKDLAGNSSRQNIAFTVNRYGSSYVFGDNINSIKGKYLKEPIDLNIEEINVDSLHNDNVNAILTRDGISYILKPNKDFSLENDCIDYRNNYYYTFPKSLFETDGIYSLSLQTVDKSGNNNQSILEEKAGHISFGIDSKAPIVYGLNISDGDTVNEKDFVAKAIVKDNMELNSLKVFVNNNETKFKQKGEQVEFGIENIEDKGNIEIIATDIAGNMTNYKIKDILINKSIIPNSTVNIDTIKEIPEKLVEKLEKSVSNPGKSVFPQSLIGIALLLSSGFAIYSKRIK